MAQKPTHGKFYWNELTTRDATAAQNFYTKTLGWTYQSFDMPGDNKYHLALDGKEPVGGIWEMKDAPSEGWLSYVCVDDVDARVQLVESNGGKVLRPAWDVEGTGRIAIIADASGMPLGLITPTEIEPASA